jgi:hypothetical protein
MANKRTIGWLLVPALLLCAACRDGSPIEDGLTPAEPGFVTDPPPQGVDSRYVSLQVSSIDGSRITLDVVVSEVDEPVTGLAIKLTYPDSFSKFTSCQDGDLFPPGGCFFSEPAPGSGEVFLSRSVNGIAEAREVVGDRVILRVEFLVFGEGSGTIVIEGQNLGGGDSSALLDLDGDPILVQWLSGVLRGD